MKPLFNILICVAFGIALINISGCDIVTIPYLKPPDTTKVDTTKYTRKVILEEYTGHHCGNCPRASLLGDGLLSKYQKFIVPLKIHAGSFAIPNPKNAKNDYSYDFRTPEGTELDNFFGISALGLPAGMVSRYGYSNHSQYLSEDYWETNIQQLIALAPKMVITLNTGYDTASKKITVDAHIKYLTNSSSNDYLALYITEDSIVAYQTDDSQTPSDVPNYVHNAVLRTSLTGTWGEQISPTGMKAGDSITITHQYTIPTGKVWRPEKLNIVAYIHDNGQTYEVWQAEYKPVISKK